MTAKPPSPSFNYIETDIPPGITIAEYRAARAREGAQPGWWRRRVARAHALRAGSNGIAAVCLAAARRTPGGGRLPTPELEVLALELPLAAPYARSMRLLEREPFDDIGALFGVLTEDPRVHWSRSELELQMGWDTVRVEDTLAELERDGLAHRHGPFTWGTRAAVRSRENMA